MPPLIGIGVPGDPPNGLLPNFTRWCASTSSTTISRNHGQRRSESTGICFAMTTAPCSGICPAHLTERDAILNCRCLNSSRSDQSISLSGNPVPQSLHHGSL
ncbi:hypothetical protein EJB05_06235 [Eragrostis curvula]|uniref:Uncharacterized protein n=1 Tax=Eragrostis curvula TaxID=38414 RepID=A0A5J9WFF4_9POAL|nr:hypothetical protein EJB05_06235 [Eragrostis curvula]